VVEEGGDSRVKDQQMERTWSGP